MRIVFTLILFLFVSFGNAQKKWIEESNRYRDIMFKGEVIMSYVDEYKIGSTSFVDEVFIVRHKKKIWKCKVRLSKAGVSDKVLCNLYLSRKQKKV